MRIKLLADFQYDSGGDCRMFSAGERNLDEPYLSAARAQGLVVEALPSAAPLATGGSAEIPTDWRTLHWFKLKALAERLSGGPIRDKAAAIAAVEAAGG